MKAPRVKQTECEGPATSDIKKLFHTSFLMRAIKSFSVATHFSRGIILNIRKISGGAPLFLWNIFYKTMCTIALHFQELYSWRLWNIDHKLCFFLQNTVFSVEKFTQALEMLHSHWLPWLWHFSSKNSTI